MIQSAPYDVIVVGAGHAGIEAALATARMGCSTLVLTMSAEAIGRMSCNPAIGGLAKGQIVREIDALGGEMGKAIDRTGIQFRMLNTRKGPAMQSPRAQADKYAYNDLMRRTVTNQTGVEVAEDTVSTVVVQEGRVTGVTTQKGQRYLAKAVILTTGTFMNGLMHSGEKQTVGGRVNESASTGLSDHLRQLGFELTRFKTGTPPRLRKSSIDFGKTTVQHGDPVPRPFSYQTETITQPQTVCWITFTNPATHKILRDNLHRAPMYSGQIKSIGPRYCPSIEDKVVRFADKDRHQIFLEPEGLNTDEIYCNGISTSTPADVQDALVHTIEGLERAEFIRYGYAVEYDVCMPHQLRHTMETKKISGLYFAGQINGTSGYEEAAGQGLIAGINAALRIHGQPPFTLSRSEAYIGVMIDDLINFELTEPYRMFTSRAEYRLLLRSDNADRRLMSYGHGLGLIPKSMKKALDEKEQTIHDVTEFLKRKFHGTDAFDRILRRPDMRLADLEQLCPSLREFALNDATREQIEIEIKYEGYIQRQQVEIERFRRMENKRLPEGLDYRKIKQLRNEAKEKLNRVRPASLGQAARIGGVSPADITILMAHLKS